MLLRFLSHATRSLNGLVPEHHRVVMGVKLLQCSGPCTARVSQQSGCSVHGSLRNQNAGLC
jgi:hypothetical protein